MSQQKTLSVAQLYETREFEEEIDKEFDRFCANDLASLAQEALQYHEFNEELYDKSVVAFTKLGAPSFVIPEKYGGSPITSRMSVSFTRKCTTIPGASDLGLSIGASNSLFTSPVAVFGDEELKAQILPQMLEGKIGAYAQTEAGAGSNVPAIKTKATKDSNGIWRITGEKIFITGGYKADYLLVLAITDPDLHAQSPDKGMSVLVVDCNTERAHILEGSKKALDTSKIEHKLGIHHSPTATAVFDDCAAIAVLGPPDDGYKKVCLPTLGASRATVIPAQAVGVGEAAYNLAYEYANRREQFGRKIIEFDVVRSMLLDMQTRNYMNWALTLQSASLKDEFPDNDSRPYEAEASLAKLQAGEEVRDIAIKALQVHGGSGYILESPITRIFVDAPISGIYEGTSQVQSLLVARKFMNVFMSGSLGGSEQEIIKEWPFSQIDFSGLANWKEQVEVYERRIRFLQDLQKVNQQYPVSDLYNLPAPLAELTKVFASLEGATLVSAGRACEAKEFADISDEGMRRAFAICDSEFAMLESTYL